MDLAWRTGWVLSLSALVVWGCKSSSEGVRDGGGAAGAGASTGGTSGGAAMSGGGTNGTGGTAAGGGQSGSGGGVRDCLPDCIVNLRRGCERPNVGTGATCTYATASDGTRRVCFSNGVVEERLVKPDASATDPNFVFYNPDGSVCYRALSTVDNTNGETITTTYFDPAGHAVAELKTIGTTTMTTETATCNGTPVPLPPSDSGCRMIDVGDCTPGACP